MSEVAPEFVVIASTGEVVYEGPDMHAALMAENRHLRRLLAEVNTWFVVSGIHAERDSLVQRVKAESEARA